MIEDKYRRRVNNVVDRLILHICMNFRNEYNVSDRLMFYNCMKFRNKWKCVWASYVTWLWISYSSKIYNDYIASRSDKKNIFAQENAEHFNMDKSRSDAQYSI